MKTMRLLSGVELILILAIPAPAQVSYTDNFTTSVNYLTNGVAGTIWDGVYLGTGYVANPTGIGESWGPGIVSVANANITAAGTLSVTSIDTDWENTNDDGFLLFKVITGDFDMSVQVLAPMNTGYFNLPGLMVRAFGAGGSPSPNGAENSFIWAPFNEFSWPYIVLNNANGVGDDTAEGTTPYPTTNLWLRITRTGNIFTLYQRGPASAPWTNMTTWSRTDFAGLPLEVGIEQADFAGGSSLPAQFANFSLTVSNQTAGTTPTADRGLVITTNANGTATLSWTQGSGSGSVVELWTGHSALEEAPANGTTYTGNTNDGSGSTLPATNHYVVYSGTGTSVTVSNLTAGTAYYAAVFGYSGSGSSLTYTHTAATGNFAIQASGGGGSGGSSVILTDSFNTSVNYLQNGLAGTIWDGVYFGSGEFVNTAGGAASTVQCNANITTADTLTVQTTGTAWEGANDDGFFLFKVVPGDFSMVVEVNTPFNAAGYNTAGLQARAFAANGNAYGGSENFISWARFEEYNYANYLRNNVDGGVEQINPGDYPNGAYWVRIDRVNGTNFLFYQRTNATSAWKLETFPAPVSGTVLTRTDLAGLPLQVGIMHATFSGQLGVSFSNFSLTESNTVFAATPSPASNLIMTTNTNETISLSWTPGTGSAGGLLAMWTSTNLVKEIPANGFTYMGSANYGTGSALPAATYSVVYVGTNSSVTVSNVIPGTTYYAGVFSYTGSGTNICYSHTPATGSVTIQRRGISGALVLNNSDVYVSFSANPGEWYWLQHSDSLSPANWQNVGLVPTIATNLLMTLAHLGGAGASQRFYRLVQLDPAFGVETGNGTITSLVRNGDVTNTQYLSGSLGAVTVRYGVNGTSWSTANTSPLSGATATYSTSPDGTVQKANYQMTTGSTGPLAMESDFAMQQAYFTWTLGLTNLGTSPVIVGDIAVQFPMNTGSPQYVTSVFKHSVIEGSGSFIFWMRNNSVGPYLLMTPDSQTQFEFWDDNGSGGAYEAYIHSAVTGPSAEAQYPTVTNSNARWRLPNTSLTLAPGASTNYTLKFQWVNNYDGVRQALTNEGMVDVHVVPGMTVPTNLFAEIALNTTQQINSIAAEFPDATQLQYLGSNGTCQLYKVQFSQLGEKMLTINYGVNQTMYLEFCVTEPIETLFKKRAAFLASHQQWAGITQWYNGLFADWNENDQIQNSPNNYDTISGFVIYEVASDDAGESRPAYMGEKESVFPVQSEVSALDLYITNFVWPPGATGGLQRKTNETDSYGVYGIDNWYELRQAGTLSLGRTYDYPHLVDMWLSMYRVAKYNPQITTAWAATNYLEAAWGTALALYTVAGAGNSTPGLMSEVVFSDLLDALQTEGMTSQYNQLLPHWEEKVAFYATGNPNLFGSEYGFDSTGFEAAEAFAKYAMTHAGSDAAMGSANPALFLQETSNFMYTEVTANMFDRGFLETPYYHYGSDFRGGGSDNFCLSYMTQMGGWGLLDYALNYATNFPDYLRLGYGSFLAGWSIMNTGTPASNYGFWYHGLNNDGACGGGYEPQAYWDTWLGQPTHRGPWYYSAEQNLGFCGAVREAATILADDPIFGRFCFGGAVETNGSTMEVVPLDGIRRRFHALLANGTLHVLLDADRFASNQPIVLNSDLSGITVQIESDNPGAHVIPLHLSASVAESYSITANSVVVASGTLPAGKDTLIQLPVQAGANLIPETFVISY